MELDTEVPTKFPPGWPEITKYAEKLSQTHAERPRNGFKARRGSQKKADSRTKSKGSKGGEGIIRPAAFNPTEESDSSEDDWPLVKRQKLSPSPQVNAASEINVQVPDPQLEPEPYLVVPNDLTLSEIPYSSKVSVVMQKLLEMQPLRTARWHEGRVRNLNQKHSFRIEAAMGYCVGNVVEKPCERCLKNVSAFEKCITVPGHFQQSCASCHYTGKATQCSFHVPNSTKAGALVDKSPSKMSTKRHSQGSIPKAVPTASITAPLTTSTMEQLKEGLKQSPAQNPSLNIGFPGLQTASNPKVITPVTSTLEEATADDVATQTPSKPKELTSPKEIVYPESMEITTPKEIATPIPSRPDVPVALKVHLSPNPEGNFGAGSITQPIISRPEAVLAATKDIFRPNIQISEDVFPLKPFVMSQRFRRALNEAEQMSLEEQEFETAELKFKISVVGNIVAKTVPMSRSSRYQILHDEFEAMSLEEQQLEHASYKFRLSVMEYAVELRKKAMSGS